MKIRRELRDKERLHFVKENREKVSKGKKTYFVRISKKQSFGRKEPRTRGKLGRENLINCCRFC